MPVDPPDPGPTAAVVERVFLFTDIEGSTRLWDAEPTAMAAAMAAHDRIARQAVQAAGGELVKGTGDGIHAAFGTAGPALQAVLAMQQALQALPTQGLLPLALRCGLHSGPAQPRDADYFGSEVNRAARIMAAAHGGQVLLSAPVAQALEGALPPGVALLDLGTVRLKDLARPERLWQLQAEGLRSGFPPPKALPAVAHNLVAPLTSLIGRDDALPALAALLAQHRLLTLLGTGGIGKSRLALQLGTQCLAGFADGAWFVELAPVDGQGADPDTAVAQAVALALGLKEQPGQPLADSLLTHLQPRQTLLVLDNCEHVLASAALLAKRLLRAAPGLRIVATSREALHIGGEACWPVPALGLPPPAAVEQVAEGRLAPEALLAHGAVRLFVDRASAARPGFALQAGNAAEVVAICRRLDGLPLAIELAAARLRALPVAALAQRLAASVALVATRDVTVTPRQRTLVELIDWSHRLLQPDEQCLFRRLAVFAGGCTLETAEAVCALSPLAETDVAELLLQLVDKSLVVLDAATGRYRMLETVRLFAAERLAELPDEAGWLRMRHLQAALDLAEAAQAQWHGPGQVAWLEQLDAERENLLAAQAWAARQPQAGEAGLRLAVALRNYWMHRGLLSVGLDGLRNALAQHDLPELARARGLFQAGHLAISLGRYVDARRDLEACVAILQRRGDRAPAASALQPLGTVLAALGQHEAASRCLQQAIDTERALNRPRQLASALVALAMARVQAQQPADAAPLYAEALPLVRALGDDDGVATIVLNQALLDLLRGEVAAATAALPQVLAIVAASQAQPLQMALFDLACALAVALRDAAAAHRWKDCADRVARRTGLTRDPADAALLAPWLDQLQQLPRPGPVPLPPAAAEDDTAAGLQALGGWAATLTPTR